MRGRLLMHMVKGVELASIVVARTRVARWIARAVDRIGVAIPRKMTLFATHKAGYPTWSGLLMWLLPWLIFGFGLGPRFPGLHVVDVHRHVVPGVMFGMAIATRASTRKRQGTIRSELLQPRDSFCKATGFIKRVRILF